MSSHVDEFESQGSSPPERARAPRAPRGRAGAAPLRETEYRTTRGAVYVIREWWHKPKGVPAFRLVEARAKTGGALIAEYTATSKGNAAVVFELYAAGIYDLSTPLADLPPEISRTVGRAWLKAEDGRCARLHVVGSKDCPHVGEDGEIPLSNPAVYAGPRVLHRTEAGEPASPHADPALEPA